MKISKWHCRHEWGFPRRWREFEGERDVDVQRCTRCGTYRRSVVQFGPERPAALAASADPGCMRQEAC